MRPTGNEPVLVRRHHRIAGCLGEDLVEFGKEIGTVPVEDLADFIRCCRSAANQAPHVIPIDGALDRIVLALAVGLHLHCGQRSWTDEF